MLSGLMRLLLSLITAGGAIGSGGPLRNAFIRVLSGLGRKDTLSLYSKVAFHTIRKDYATSGRQR